MDLVLAGVAPFFAIVAIGAGAAMLGRVDLEAVRGINAFVFYVGMPALLLSVFLRIGDDVVLDVRFAAVYAAASIVHLGLAIAAARVFQGLKAGAAGGQAMAAIVGNTTFLALPLTLSVFGDAAAPYAALAALVDNALILPLAVAALLAGRGSGLGAAVREGALGALKNPIVIAAFIGLAAIVSGVSAPGPALQVIDTLAAAASPVALFSLGAMIALRSDVRGREVAAPAAWAVAMKLVVFPALVWAALTYAGVSDLGRAIGTVFAAAPTAVNVFVQTTAYGVYAKEATAAVAATTLVSAVTLSAWLVFAAG